MSLNFGASRVFIALSRATSLNYARRSNGNKPDLCAVLVNNPGGKLRSISSMTSFGIITFGSLSSNLVADLA